MTSSFLQTTENEAFIVTSDLEDDELRLLYFALLGDDVITEASVHPGVHGLLSVLEQF